VSLYQLQKAMYQYLNPKGDSITPSLDRESLMRRFDLSGDEIDAVLSSDVKALYRLGVHPVLLNSFARARVPRDQYRAALAELEAQQSAVNEASADR
jgi:hypothetical protein